MFLSTAIHATGVRMKTLDLKGKWVLVTGASAGLGKAFATRLARHFGANVVLLARRKELLEALATELRGAGVEVAVIAADLSKIEDTDRAIAEALEGRKLTAAVLNAGISHFGPFDELSWPGFLAMLHINVNAVVRMTTELIPHLEGDPQGGAILIVSSMAGFTPVAYQTAYSATKAFLISFGMGMWHELQGRNVSITTYVPAGIQTEWTANEKFGSLRGWLADVDSVASAGLDALRRRRFLAIPGAQNRLGDVLFRFLPRQFITGRVAAVYRKALREVSGGKGV
jgi:short-subunit dehydrogenase